MRLSSTSWVELAGLDIYPHVHGGNSLNGRPTWSFLKHLCLRVARLLTRQFKAEMQVSPKRARQHLYYLFSSGRGSYPLLLITTCCLLRKSRCPTSFKGKDRLPPLDGGWQGSKRACGRKNIFVLIWENTIC